mmetsp:Transcript_17561/g.50091  ORF Transcript_17561/g.50091 Transcript_17561/m.50091 type:complete len:402 (-) Transcript_17561:589-1794(-)
MRAVTPHKFAESRSDESTGALAVPGVQDVRGPQARAQQGVQLVKLDVVEPREQQVHVDVERRDQVCLASLACLRRHGLQEGGQESLRRGSHHQCRDQHLARQDQAGHGNRRHLDDKEPLRSHNVAWVRRTLLEDARDVLGARLAREAHSRREHANHEEGKGEAHLHGIVHAVPERLLPSNDNGVDQAQEACDQELCQTLAGESDGDQVEQQVLHDDAQRPIDVGHAVVITNEPPRAPVLHVRPVKCSHDLPHHPEEEREECDTEEERVQNRGREVVPELALVADDVGVHVHGQNSVWSRRADEHHEATLDQGGVEHQLEEDPQLEHAGSTKAELRTESAYPLDGHTPEQPGHEMRGGNGQAAVYERDEDSPPAEGHVSPHGLLGPNAAHVKDDPKVDVDVD